ncbi:DNA double-strand break repair protein Mre11 [Natronomonas marina]|uniref:DNA double-strand break repair protein Mre11 n=1 Tax=Natronomonas marina TaxID=2961939 RepID=UPI0020C96917|nr:DNA double-strand break repair protein Mre11 [Natronomonas marina]
MTRVIHTGDTHLGYRQYHLPERREDFLDAFRRVATDAIEDDVDAVVHAGDLFHDRRPGLSDLLGAQSVLESLDDADIPFLAVVGNHETKRDAQWLDLFEAMGLATRLGQDPVVVGDTAFYGLDFVPRNQRADLDYEFEPHDADHAALVSHGLFEPLVPDYGNVEWDAAEVLAEATVDFDALLLGDEHAATRAEVDGTWVTYCGSTERTSASEREERGYNIVEFDDGVHVARRGIETRAFVFVDLELAEGEGFERVRERLREHDLADAVVTVTLSGAGESVSAARIENFAAEEGALVARVTDRREVSEEADLDVAFADPDEAVRERVRELGLSDAARDLDETIRASKVADSNVSSEVERRVGDLLEEPSAFESAPAEEPETVADRLGDDGDDADDGPTAEDRDDPAAADGDSAEPTTDESEAGVGVAGSDAPSEEGSGTDVEPDVEDDTSPAGDDQASMEDYL